MAITVDDLTNWLGLTTPTTANRAELQRCIDAVQAFFATHYELPDVDGDDITMARLLQASRLFKRRQTPEGIAAFDIAVIRVSRLDPDVEQLMSPYWMPGFA